MALDTSVIEVVLEGLSEKSDKKLTAPGKLRVAQNVEFDKVGAMNKRRGYERVPIDNTLGGASVELLLMNVATMRDELVIFGSEQLLSLASLSSSIGLGTDEAFVVRGPVLRGGYSLQHVVSGGLGGAR